MSTLQQIAFFQNRRDEIPNQLLAKELVANQDLIGIQEIADHLWHSNPNVQSDCLKVMYEIGYLAPNLIANYWGKFLQLLKSKNNRLVWGSMIAISTIASLKAAELYEHVGEIQKAMANGSVITIDNGVQALALIAAANEKARQEILPFLLHHLASCRPKEVPQHSEKVLLAVDTAYKTPFLEILQQRMADLSPAQAGRVRRVMRQAEKL